MRSLIALVLIGGFLVSCNTKLSKEDQKSIMNEMKNREIKKISDSEIYAAAMGIGDSIATLSQQTLGSHLKSTIQQQGVVAAIEYCNVNAYPLIDSLSNEYKAIIRRKSLRARNPADHPDAVERQILEAYAYNLENDLELSANIQKVGKDTVLYTRPILLNNTMCLMCHGKEAEISAEVADIIKSKYPDDNATGHEMNDLRGIWSIRLPVREIVNTL